MSLLDNNLSSYKDIKDKIKSFDLLAFRGDDFISNTIANLELEEIGSGEFSHVGMAVRSDILPFCIINGKQFNLEPDHVYILESTFIYNIPGETHNIPDVIANHCKIGVQLRNFEEIIPIYITDKITKIAWCKLINNPLNRLSTDTDDKFINRQLAVKERFKQLFMEYYGRLYEMSFINLLSSIFPSLRPLRYLHDEIYISLYKALHLCGIAKNDSGPAGWQFCSELIANIYQSYNIISAAIDTKNIVPVDFFGYDKNEFPAVVESPVFIKNTSSSLLLN